MCKESILSLYSEINNSKFLKRYGKEYVKKLKTMLFPYFMGLSKILGTILGTNIL